MIPRTGGDSEPKQYQLVWRTKLPLQRPELAPRSYRALQTRAVPLHLPQAPAEAPGSFAVGVCYLFQPCSITLQTGVFMLLLLRKCKICFLLGVPTAAKPRTHITPILQVKRQKQRWIGVTRAVLQHTLEIPESGCRELGPAMKLMHYFVPRTIKLAVLGLCSLTQIRNHSPLSPDLHEVLFRAASVAFSLLLSASRSVFLLFSSRSPSGPGHGWAQTWTLPVLFAETLFLWFSVVIAILFLRAAVL